jgi:hypothetical protein
MGYRKLFLLSIAVLYVVISGCGDKKNNPLPGNEDKCFSGKVLKNVNDQKGRVQYNPFEKSYAIYGSIPGTYDSVDAGFICDKLDSLKKDGLIVNFSGNYYAYKPDVKSPVGGLEYYYLDLTNFKIVEQ